MGNYEQLKQSVSDVIKTNGNQEITGSILQNVLLTIISTVGANATFAGVATPTTNPGTPDGPVFYLASEGGTYTNFNAIVLQDGLSVLMWNGSWNRQQILNIDDEPTAGSDNLVKSGGVSYEFSKREGESNNSDFEINDDKNFSIVKFQKGHVKTKNFDSSFDASPTSRGLMSANDKTKLNSIEDGAEANDVYTEDDSNSDFEINDDNNFSIVKFQNGHIKTKNFDSELLITSKFKGKYMSIIGDSVSSFNENIYRPSNKYSTAYPNPEYYDITSVDQMWWKIVCDNLEISPLRNASWGGTSVCGVPNNPDGNCGCCQKRIDDLTNGINNPDIVMIAMGINDFVDLSHLIAVGTFDADAPFPTPVDNVAINVFADAYALMINRIQIKYPNAKIFCLTMYPFFKSTATTGIYPCKNKENELLITYNNVIKTICDAVGINVIDVHRCGISKENIENYTGELLHLNAAGQSLVARYVIGNLISKF